MALQISYDAATGDSYTAAYLRVRRWDIDFVNREATVTAELFRDAAARQADRRPLETFTRVMGAAVVTAILARTDGDPRPAIYQWLKLASEFGAAVDV